MRLAAILLCFLVWPAPALKAREHAAPREVGSVYTHPGRSGGAPGCDRQGARDDGFEKKSDSGGSAGPGGNTLIAAAGTDFTRPRGL